jgi:hypothetical protein
MNNLSDETLRKFASYAEEEMRELGIDVRHDRDTVAWIDGYILKNRTRLTEQRMTYLSAVFAAFVGECMIDNFGCTWRWVEEFEQCGVHHPIVGTAFVFSKMNKHFTEDGESILTLYDFMASRIGAGESGATGR